MAIVQHVKCLGVGLALAASSAAFAQSDGPDESVGGPLSGPIPFVNAPFSADAITTVRHNLRNATRLEQSTTARYYRDSGGRVRVERLMEGLRAPKTPSERHIRLAVYPMADVYPNVAEPRVFTLDEVTRTTRGAAGERSSTFERWRRDSRGAGWWCPIRHIPTRGGVGSARAGTGSRRRVPAGIAWDTSDRGCGNDRAPDHIDLSGLVCRQRRAVSSDR